MNNRPSTCKDDELSRINSLGLYASFPLLRNTKQIRLLELEAPYPDTDAQQLRGRLRVVSLSSSPKYTALSYVWGTVSSADDTIVCGDHHLGITRNCREALYHLRETFRPLVIWVDAICINQQDEAEKNYQLLLMGEIYEWATTVYIWLGPGTPSAYYAMESLHPKPTHYMGLTAVDIANTTRGYYHRMIPLMSFSPMGRPNFSQTTKLYQMYRRDAFDDLLGREWLERLWTFQELLLARNPVLVCGEKFLGWDDFLCGLHTLHEMQLADSKLPNQFGNWWDVCSTWLHLDRPTHWNGHEVGRTVRYDDIGESLRSRVFKGRQIRSTSFYACQKWWETFWTMGDPRLGYIVVRWLLLLISIAGFVLFVLSITEVIKRPKKIIGIILFPSLYVGGLILIFFGMFCEWYWEHALRSLEFSSPGDYCLTKGQIMNGLHRTIRTNKVKDPKDRSFAMRGVLANLGVVLAKPDYGQSLGEVYLDLFVDLIKWSHSLNYLLDSGYPTLAGAPSWVPNFDAAAGKTWLHPSFIYSPDVLDNTPKPAFKLSDSTLTVKTIYKDRIVFCSSRLLPATEGRNAKDQMQQNRHTHNISTLSDWIYPIQSGNRFIRTDQSPLQGRMMEALHARLAIHITAEEKTHFKKWYDNISTINPSDTTSVNGFLSLLSENIALLRYHLTLCDSLANQRILFLTEKGFLGTGNLATRPRDQIVLVAGVAMPLILREVEKETSHKVIGPAFVQGWMEGELWREERDSEIKLV